MGNEITKMQQNGDESGAATCGMENKLCVMIGSEGRSPASHPGHDQSVFIPRCEKYHYTMRHPPPSPGGPSASVG
jgi:hypothetical protein